MVGDTRSNQSAIIGGGTQFRMVVKYHGDEYPGGWTRNNRISKLGETDQEGRELDRWKLNKKKNEKRKDNFLPLLPLKIISVIRPDGLG